MNDLATMNMQYQYSKANQTYFSSVDFLENVIGDERNNSLLGKFCIILFRFDAICYENPHHFHYYNNEVNGTIKINCL